MNESINILNFQPIGLTCIPLLTSRWLTQSVPFNFSRVTASNLSHPQRSKQRGANITVFKCWSAYFCWLSTAAVFLWLKYNHEGCLTRLSPANDSWQRLDDLLRLFMIARPILTFTGDPHTPQTTTTLPPPCVSATLLQAWAFAASAHFRLQSLFESSSRHNGLFHLLLFTQLFNHSALFHYVVSSLFCLKMNHWFKLNEWALRHE